MRAWAAVVIAAASILAHAEDKRDDILDAIVGISTKIPVDAPSAATLGTERRGSGALIREGYGVRPRLRVRPSQARCAACGQAVYIASRRPFAGSWEYHLDSAIFTYPAVMGWSGAALIGTKGELLGIGSLIVPDAGAPRTQSAGNMFVPSIS
jgi:hypothetical protein